MKRIPNPILHTKDVFAKCELNLRLHIKQTTKMSAELLAAIHTLYSSSATSSPQQLEQANQLLTSVQHHPHTAIHTIQTLLTHAVQHRDPHVEWFAASTLYQITRKYYCSPRLSVEDKKVLAGMVMDAVTRGDLIEAKNIRVQLARALASVAVQSSLEDWNEPVKDLIGKFVQGGAMMVLLEVLNAIPEELNESKKYFVTEEQDDRAHDIVESSCEQVLGLLQSFVTHLGEAADPQSKELRKLAVKCLSPWLSVAKYVFDKDQTKDPDIWAVTPLLALSFNALHDPELFEDAIDCVLVFVKLSSDYKKYRKLMEILVTNVLQLRVAYVESGNNSNGTTETGLCRLFVQIAESYAEFLIDVLSEHALNDELAKVANEIIELVLLCASNKDQEISILTFNFWFILSERFIKLNEPSQMKNFTDRLQNHFLKLIEYLDPMLKFPDDFDSLDAEDLSICRKQRYEATLVLQDVTCMLTEQSIMEYLVKRLQSLPENASWQESESILYIIRSIARNLDPKENTYLPSIMAFIPSLGSRHPMILYTCVSVIGRYSLWINEHVNMLHDFLQFLITALQQSLSLKSSQNTSFKVFDYSSAAALSIKQICVSCASNIAVDSGKVSLIFGAYDMLVRDRISLTSQSSSIDDDHLEIIEALAVVVSHLFSSSAENGLSHVVNPVLADISQIMMHTSYSHSENYTLLVQSQVLVLAHFFKFYQGSCSNGSRHPVFAIIENLWKTSEILFDRYANDEMLMENLCRIWKHIIRDMRRKFPVELVLYPLLTKVVNLFANVPHSCFIYIASVAVSEFGNSSPQFVTLFSQLFNILCDYSIRLLHSSDQ
jgi:transportin-3